MDGERDVEVSPEIVEELHRRDADWPLHGEPVAELILANLTSVFDDPQSGAVVSLSTTRLRVRTLPMH
jgi:hypothetical protein